MFPRLVLLTRGREMTCCQVSVQTWDPVMAQ